MAKRKTLSSTGVANLKPRAKRYAEPDPELRGHYVRVAATGAKSFVAVARNPAGKQVWATIGATDVFDIEEARETARDAIKRIRAGLPAFEAPTVAQSFKDVAENWLKRHVQASHLRSEREITRLLTAHVLPALEGRAFLSIRRSDIAALLDQVEDEHGARQADYVLAIVRGICNWFAARHDHYVPPIARGMRRTDPRMRKRSRILDDDELRDIWNEAQESGTFGAFLRIGLLTAQRREKVIALRWGDLSDEGEWRIPVAAREKGTGGVLVLPNQAIEIIRAQPRFTSNPYVFAGRGEGHFSGFSKAKSAFDAKLPNIAPWMIHDLRRTARSLMSRAGVRPDIAERVMGHVIAGVEGVYDRYSYRAEKADALSRLSAIVEDIISVGAQ